MGAFLSRIGIFFLLWLGCGAILNCLSPYHFGEENYTRKIEKLDTDENQRCNTFFFGSSTIACHVIPSVFDSICEANNSPLISYNLGVQATFSPESIHLIEHFLQTKNSIDKTYCFLELTNPRIKSPLGRPTTNKLGYWLSAKNLHLLVRHELDLKNYKQAIKNLIFGTYHLLQSTAHPGVFSEFGKRIKLASDGVEDDIARGFHPINRPLSLDSTSTTGQKLKFYLANADSLLQAKRKKALKDDVSSPVHPPKFYHSRLQALQTLATSKNTELYFILSPNWSNSSVLSLRQLLGPKQIIDLHHPNNNPEFYLHEYHADLEHLNPLGAHAFTVNLAKQFCDLNESRK